MRIPADCIVLEDMDLATDESAMTGEPEQMEKCAITDQNYEENPDCFLLGKSLVVSG